MNPVAGLVDVADILLAEKNRLDRMIAALLVCDARLGCILCRGSWTSSPCDAGG